MRKLATVAAVSLALASGGAFGLVLGEIEMQSALNQPMSAEIRLTSVKAGELEGMIVQLAAPEAFTRAGIERSSVLTSLRFSVDQSSGVPVIKIQSTRPVIEPFLNFLLEVDWPQGRMVREYTVLLDPPVFMSPSASDRNSAADRPALLEGGDSALVVPTPIVRNDISAESGLEVELGDLVDENTPEVLSLEEATATSLFGDEGELVTLDELADESLAAIRSSLGESVTDDQGAAMALSDLSAPNTAATAELEANAAQTLELDDIQVQTVGGIEEVSDDVVVDESGQPIEVVEVDDGSTLVSLDDLEEPEVAEVDDGSTLVALDDLEEPVESAASQITVGNGDTLFEIANDVTPSGVSVQQMMMAMLAVNESAFINGNINLVRAGAILRVPDAGQAGILTQAEALAAISDQNQLWQDYRDSVRANADTQVAQSTTSPSDESAADPIETAADPIETAALDTNVSDAGLSEEAQRILDNARQEITSGEELNIVADNTTADTTANSTADETDNSDAALIGEVNRKVQLAREELASTRLRSDDLSDQASQLADTSNNLDAMVSLRQNEVARLEAQLAEARQAAEEQAAAEQAAAEEAAAEQAAAEQAAAEEAAAEEAAAEEAAAELALAEQAAAEQAATEAAVAEQAAAERAAAELAANATEADSEAPADTAEVVSETVAELTDTVDATVDNAAEQASDTVGAIADAGDNALSEAGEALEQVERGADGDEAEAADTASPVATTKAWYQEFLEDPKRMGVAGVGALGLLGVMGTLLFRRKRRAPQDSMLDDIDEAQFNDELPAEAAADSVINPSRLDDTTGAVAAAGAAAGAADATLDEKHADVFEKSERPFISASDDDHDSTLAFGAADHDESLLELGMSNDDESLDNDDTISEVDVYLAYGLHGQAEELLTKAIERKPDNAEYAKKLLQTYHAQGNNEAFHQSAQDFHQRFDGDNNPAWPSIAQMGTDLAPGDALYVAAQGAVQRVDAVNGISQFDDVDFASSSDDDGQGSVSRDFGESGAAVDVINKESDLLDQSIDPAFEFDESDLEATGDFSSIADEIAADNASDADNGSVQFPGFEDSGAAANEALEAATPDLDMSDLNDSLSLDELDGLTDSVDDLTLDLDQLSGDLELDSAELLDADLSDLDIPDLTAENELQLDSTGALGEGADEMDTMLDLAKAYIDMGDKDSASSALGEIVKSGSPEQVTEAETLLRKIS